MKKLYLLFFVLVSLYLFTDEGLKPSAPSLPGELPCLYSTQAGDLLQDTLVTAIKTSKKSVILVIYTLKDPKIIQALNEQASKKVKVKVIYDATASLGVDLLLGKSVTKVPRISTGLMHLKILMIDSHAVWLGSANMVRESLKNHGNLIAHIDHPEFSSAILNKCNQLCQGTFEKPIEPQIFKIKKQQIELRFLPDDKTAVDRLKKMIDSAKKTVQVAMYTFTREDLAECLVQAHERGVKVEVVIDKATAINASKKIVAFLKKKKVPLYLNDSGGVMHNKFVFIDDKSLAHGSANWTKAAFHQNDDYIMIMTNLSAPQRKVLHSIWSSLTLKGVIARTEFSHIRPLA